MTSHQFRVLLIVPVARQSGLNAFCKEFDPDGQNWIIVPMSATGAEPATHYATCFSCTLADTQTWATRLTTDGGVPLPPGFSSYTADQRISFMMAARPTLKALTGVVVYVCRNDQFPWFEAQGGIEGILQSEGIQRITADATTTTTPAPTTTTPAPKFMTAPKKKK